MIYDFLFLQNLAIDKVLLLPNNSPSLDETGKIMPENGSYAQPESSEGDKLIANNINGSY